MNIWIERIFLGCELYQGLALSLFVPVVIAVLIRSRRINVVRFAVDQLFCFYMCCLFALVFLPLPTMAEAQDLSYRFQLIPFYAIYDIVKTGRMSAVFCLVFNIVMTVPFGMFLKYNWKLSFKTVLILGFALTAFIEIGQLTGLFFLFKGSYRLCDVDDLITNTLGTGIGYLMISRLEAYIPALDSFEHKPETGTALQAKA